jgi:hypothetical protein
MDNSQENKRENQIHWERFGNYTKKKKTSNLTKIRKHFSIKINQYF